MTSALRPKPRRRLRQIVGIRLNPHGRLRLLAHELREEPERGERGHRARPQIFNAQQTQCTTCHVGGPAGKQFFTDKKPLAQLDNPAQCGGPDHNNPFVRHNVGTANLFDNTDPYEIALRDSNFPNPRLPQAREPGAAHRLRDPDPRRPVEHGTVSPRRQRVHVARRQPACNASLDDCLQPGRGRNISGQHGVTAMLTPQQLNDLVAFEKTLTTGTVVGGEQTQLRTGMLSLSRVVLQFPRRGKHGKPPRPGARGGVAVSGVLSPDAGSRVDPSAGVSVSLAAPDGEQMAVLAADVP